MAARTKAQQHNDNEAIDINAEIVEIPVLADEQPTPLQVLPELPPADAPAINASEPDVSFKIDFTDKSQWFASEDGGSTKEGIGSRSIIATPIDLVLQLNKANWGDGYDQRLRLALLIEEEDGTPYVAEINLNAVNRTHSGELYVTSPARSLTGALLAISEAVDDMECFCRLSRFTVRPGRGRGVFIDVDIPVGKQWVAMSSAGRTNQVPKDPAGFHSQLALIKSRFRGAGLLLTAGAITGDIRGYDAQCRHLLQGSDDSDPR